MSVHTSLGPAGSPVARANFWGQGTVDTAYARGCKLGDLDCETWNLKSMQTSKLVLDFEMWNLRPMYGC